jgi:hypothetical protein
MKRQIDLWRWQNLQGEKTTSPSFWQTYCKKNLQFSLKFNYHCADGRASGGDTAPDLAAELWVLLRIPARLTFRDRDFGPTAEVPAIFILGSINKGSGAMVFFLSLWKSLRDSPKFAFILPRKQNAPLSL